MATATSSEMRGTLRGILLSTAAFCVFPLLNSTTASAACVPAAPYNNGVNIVVCAPGAGETFNTLGGNDTVTLNSGTVGTVTMSTGDDTYIHNAGTATTVNQNDGIDTATIGGGTLGTLNQGNGAGTFSLNAGNVTTAVQGTSADFATIAGGTLGSINQGTGDDSLAMTGGSAGNVNQGAGLDSAAISSGTITSLLQGSESDTLVLSGTGAITTMDQGSANDTLTMSGGSVGTLLQNTGNDSLTMTGGSAGNVNQGAGLDSVTISAGAITSLLQGSENDTLSISGTGAITTVDQGNNDDFATISGGTLGSLVQGSGIDNLDFSGGSITTIDQGTSNDTMTMSGGAVTGGIQQGSGNDILVITAGMTGAIDQSSGDDYFSMVAGVAIASLDQGTNLDQAFISGGHIIGLLNQVDYVEFTGGRIGAVDMVADNNQFYMSGSALIDAYLNAEGGIDLFDLGGGTIGTSVNSGSGNDTITLHGTIVGTSVDMESGNDIFTMTSGTVGTDVLLGAGTDTATFSGGLVGGSVLGGANNDTITLNGAAIAAGIQGDAGNDIFAMTSGTVGTDVLLGAGTDTATLSGGSVGGSVLGGANNDTITLNGAAIAAGIQGDAGNDRITVTSGSAGNIYGDTTQTTGTGADTIALNGGTVSGLVSGGNGNDSITLNGMIVSGSVAGDSGNDTLVWTAGSAPLIDGGAGSDTLTVSALEYDGSQILNGGDDVSTADGWSDTLTLNGLTVTANGANILNWETVRVVGGQLAISGGALTVGSDANRGLFLQNNGNLEAQNALLLTGNLNIAAGSTYNGTGGGAGLYGVSGSLVNNGALNTTDGFAGDALTVGGNYSGSGQFLVDASLDVTTTADTLAINGGVLSGATSIVVNDVGNGVGSLTGTGAGNGIRIVDVSTTGNTSAGDFILSSGAISVGAFTYDLVLESDGIWYLQSTVNGVAASAATTTALAESIELTFLATLHERVGEQEHVGQRQLDGTAASGMWARVVGKRASEVFSTSSLGDLQAESTVAGLQAGFDLYRGKSEAGSTTHVGVYGGYAWSNADVEAQAALGSISTNNNEGWLAGLYATHYNAAGWYSDAVLQGSWLDMVAADEEGRNLSTISKDWLASLEVGMPLAIDDSGSNFEPQAQLIYRSAQVDNATDSAGLAYRFDNNDSLIGRAGFRLKGTKDNGDGENGRGLVTGYLKANMWATLMGGESSMMAGGTPVQIQGKTLWADAGLGFTVQGSKNLELFADGGMKYGLNQRYSAFTGIAGVRLNW